jgi:hypothetical protein
MHDYVLCEHSSHLLAGRGGIPNLSAANLARTT